MAHKTAMHAAAPIRHEATEQRSRQIMLFSDRVLNAALVCVI